MKFIKRKDSKEQSRKITYTITYGGFCANTNNI